MLLTCEHGGHEIPARYAALFRGQAALLRTHRGWDIGALALARRLAKHLRVPLIEATTSRLLVDLNRSSGHPNQFSRFTKALPPAERARIEREHHRPYRDRVEREMSHAVTRGERILHIAVHSFTPELNGVRRKADLGLLHDPARVLEAALCKQWQRLLRRHAPEYAIHLNSPYRGWTDGLITHLRRRYPARLYVGIEIETNQRHWLAPDKGGDFATVIEWTLRRLLENANPADK